MPTPTYTPLATVTLASSASSVTFSSIPATYRDLILVFVGTPSTDTYARVRFNGDTGSNYNYVFMYGDGSTAVSSAFASQTFGYTGNTDAAIGNTIVQIMDYPATDKHKTYLSRNMSSSGGLTMATAGRWANTSVINSIQVSTNAGTFNSGFTFSLYGVIS
jgi:peptide methionine sulfoxide reductase MsrA